MLTVRDTRSEDVEALDELYRYGFGRPLSITEWRWKYRESPCETRSLVACNGSGRLLAHVGALALPGRWRGGAGPMWSLVDFVGRREGSGLRPPLVVAGRRLLADLPRPGDVPWNYGFPSRRHFELGQRVFGYQPVRELRRWSGPLTRGRLDRQQVEAVEVCGPWVEAVWEACGAYGIRRSAEYLNWRYWARPERYYRSYRLHAGELEGLVVAAFVGRDAWLAELWLPPGASWGRCLESVAEDLRQSGMERWCAWPPPPALGGEELLGSLGMEPEAETVILGCRGRKGARVADEVAQMTFTMGDHDIV